MPRDGGTCHTLFPPRWTLVDLTTAWAISAAKRCGRVDAALRSCETVGASQNCENSLGYTGIRVARSIGVEGVDWLRSGGDAAPFLRLVEAADWASR